ncbi:MAG: manganese efflux pump MntP family protein [bacterium]|nr:manganese efflux pump MntP family protein [bacterium]
MISLELLAAALALGCDAFSVAIGVGSQGLNGRRLFRLSFHFGLFQFFMPLIGLAIGSLTASMLGEAGRWVAAGCLVIIGINMARQAIWHEDSPASRKDPTRGWLLVLLSVSTSVDALVAGFSLGLLGQNILAACLFIGVTAAAMTIAGMLLGAGAARALGKWAEILGGIVLVVLATSFIL